MSEFESKTFKDLLSNIRHDLRTPVGHIIGYSEMLAEELEDEHWPEFEEDLKHIRASGERLVELIDEHIGPEKTCVDQLDIPYVQESIRTQLNHISGYAEILEELAEEFERKELLPDLGKISGASRSLLQIVESRLTITAFEGLDEPVSDSIRETLIQANSGQGKAGPVGPSGLGEGGDILVVDDDESNRELLKRRLRRQGYLVISKSGGQEALDYLNENRVDVVLLDMMMPGMTGLEVLERLKADKVLSNIPVIMLSGLDDMNQIVKCILLGAEDYLFKPFNPVLLKARLSATLEKHRLRKQAARRMSVFISSPGDVTPERRIVKHVIGRINEELSGQVFLTPVMWEDEPLLASETAQTQIVNPHDTDFYIGIFWYRMGTMLPEEITRSDGSRYGSGSEFEFEDAITGCDETGSPDILVYRKTTDPTISLTNREHVMDCLDQKEKLEDFLAKWFTTSDGKSIARVYHAFDDIEEFEELVYGHLRKLILRNLEKN